MADLANIRRGLALICNDRDNRKTLFSNAVFNSTDQSSPHNPNDVLARPNRLVPVFVFMNFEKAPLEIHINDHWCIMIHVCRFRIV